MAAMRHLALLALAPILVYAGKFELVEDRFVLDGRPLQIISGR